jgi:hypothetical protein
MPVRFATPGLGGQTESFLRKGQWQAGFAYRRLYADKWFIGTKVDESLPILPLYLDINSYDLSIAYGLTNQISLQLTLPFSYGTHSRIYPEADNLRHEVSAGGLGDINLIGTYWIWDPHTHLNKNLSLGLGVKTPSGSNTVHSTITLADGTVIPKLVDQSIQLGDGGWGVIFQSRAYWSMFHALYGYFDGTYLMSTKESTDVPSPLGPDVPLAVPDVYSARAGLALPLWAKIGLSVSLGGRIDGIPKRDVIGGGDLAFRRPGYIVYVDPGIGVAIGPHTLTVNVPVRVYQDFQPALINDQIGISGGGDLADYLIIAQYTFRF